jgi:uncharacterized protein YajQ (UPF0234 family)
MNFILTLIKNNYLKYILIFLIASLIYSIFLYKIYSIGYDKAELKYLKLEQEQLKIIEENNLKIKKLTDDLAEKSIKKDVEIKTIYKDKIKEVEKIVTKIEYKNCKLTDEDYTKFVEILGEIK